MALRELISGGAACSVPSSSSSSNPLIGSSSKTQERLQEIPTSTNAISEGNLFVGGQEPFNVLPGSEFGHPTHPSSQGSEFLRGYRSLDQNRFTDAWDEIQNSQVPLFQGRDGTNIPLEHTRLQPDLDGEI